MNNMPSHVQKQTNSEKDEKAKENSSEGGATIADLDSRSRIWFKHNHRVKHQANSEKDEEDKENSRPIDANIPSELSGNNSVVKKRTAALKRQQTPRTQSTAASNTSASAKYRSCSTQAKWSLMSSANVVSTDTLQIIPPSRLHINAKLCEYEFARYVRPHIINPNCLHEYGYPVVSANHQRAMEYEHESPEDAYQLKLKTNYLRNVDGSVISFYSENEISVATVEGCEPIYGERQCLRCQSAFYVTKSGEYFKYETCFHHPGKLRSSTINPTYNCCGCREGFKGCAQNSIHVWSGSIDGLNGPFREFVQTRPRSMVVSVDHFDMLTKVYALDCDIAYTHLGLIVSRIAVVNYHGAVVYEHYVRPDLPIVDFDTRVSGITAKDFHPSSGKSIKSLAEVQNDLLQLFHDDTILIGHELDKDLRALRFVHKTIIDTSIVFPHPEKYPYRSKLEALMKDFLKRNFQCDDEAHNCSAVAKATLALMKFRIRA